MKTVLITGANRGLGNALAIAFGAQGHQLILHSRVKSFESIPGKISVVHGDLREETACENLVLAAERQDVDIVVHNAGIYRKGVFADLSGDDFLYVLETNLVMPIILTHALWPIFERKRSGMIVFINSLAGKQGGDGETAYSASKHGLAGFARSLQFDASQIGVKVLSVFLGAMRTDMTRHHRTDWGQLIDPHDAARAIVGLCEEHATTLGIREVEIGRTIY